jgi:hypothetical protein
MQELLGKIKGHHHLSTGGEVLLQGRLDTLGLLASAGSCERLEYCSQSNVPLLLEG